MKSFTGLLAVLLVSLASPAATAETVPGVTPLFASEDVLQLSITGPLDEVTRRAERNDRVVDAVLTLHTPRVETHAVRISPRGLTRRRSDICTFAPLRVEFVQPPGAGSLFKGQKRLKLVTHCQEPEGFQQYVLLEHSAYRLFNVITRLSFRTRLARINYVKTASARPALTRVGYFIEDVDDVARRNGLREVETGNIRQESLEPGQAARFAVFQYMIGNLDWAMTAGPPGRFCCHNSRLLSAIAGAATRLATVPYDFDHSGLVDAPYATPPELVRVSSVRERRYRGYCRHNGEALTAAREARQLRLRLEAVFSDVPGLEERTRRKALSYLAGFFKSVATDQGVEGNLLKHCLR